METTINNIVSKKFKEIKAHFTKILNNSNKKTIFKTNSYSNYNKRPHIANIRHKSVDKLDLSNILEQIGNDDLIFNNDKLITNIKIESFQNSVKKRKSATVENDRNNRSFLSKNIHKKNCTSTSLRNINTNNKLMIKKQTKDYSKTTGLHINNNSLELNCNKIAYTNESNRSHLNRKKVRKNSKKSTSHNRNVHVKNVDQFINKPSERYNRNDNKNYLMTPINNKTTTKIQNNKKLLSKLKNDNNLLSQRILNINNNETISVASTSRCDKIKSVIRGRSMPTMRQNTSQSILRLPNKSIIKNNDKLMMELQKLFGEKIFLNEEIYNNMTELDKKNCINFLLETVKEFNNINKIYKSKVDGCKQIIEEKESQIKQQKKENKELKKENFKLNKIIKNNNQLNKKLIQKIENLKIQLEKEKKNNNKEKRHRSIPNNKNISIKTFRNNNNLNKYQKTNENKTQDNLRKAKGFINRRKIEDLHDKIIKTLDKNEINRNNQHTLESTESNKTFEINEEKKINTPQNLLVMNDSKGQNLNNLNVPE